MKRSIFLLAIFALVISACAAQATPTIDVAAIQASAIAMVSTSVEQTRAAIPTPTLTSTPLPTQTPSPSPTVAVTEVTAVGTQVSSSNGTADPCNHPLSGGPVAAPDAGKTKATNILIVNSTKGPVTFSLYLVKNVMGECGYVGYTIAKSNSIMLSNVLPNGCYYAHAYVNDPKHPANLSRGPDCLTGQDKTTYTVTNDEIRLVGP